MNFLAVRLTTVVWFTAYKSPAISSMNMDGTRACARAGLIEDSILMERIRSARASTLNEEAPKSRREPSHQRPPGHPILHLQRSLGNRAVQRFITARMPRVKVKMLGTGANFLQEKDRVMEGLGYRKGPTLSTKIL